VKMCKRKASEEPYASRTSSIESNTELSILIDEIQIVAVVSIYAAGLIYGIVLFFLYRL
jgi:hypothetical protein